MIFIHGDHGNACGLNYPKFFGFFSVGNLFVGDTNFGVKKMHEIHHDWSPTNKHDSKVYYALHIKNNFWKLYYNIFLFYTDFLRLRAVDSRTKFAFTTIMTSTTTFLHSDSDLPTTDGTNWLWLCQAIMWLYMWTVWNCMNRLYKMLIAFRRLQISNYLLASETDNMHFLG